MKQIVLLYVGALLLCFFFGGVISLAFHYSLWCLILLSIPISFGWVMFADVFMRINDKNLGNVASLTVISFLIMVGLLMMAYYYRMGIRTSFYGMAYFIGVASYMVGLLIIGEKLLKMWEEKKGICSKDKIGIL